MKKQEQFNAKMKNAKIDKTYLRDKTVQVKKLKNYTYCSAIGQGPALEEEKWESGDGEEERK